MGKAGDSTPDSADADRFVTAVLAAAWLLTGISTKSLDDVDGRVTLTQFRTMAVLARRGKINLSRLASDLGVNVSTAMRSIDRLIAAGYANRGENPETRREVVLELTPVGDELVSAVVARRRVELGELLGAMSEVDRDSLARGLSAFVETADRCGLRPATPAALGW